MLIANTTLVGCLTAFVVCVSFVLLRIRAIHPSRRRRPEPRPPQLPTRLLIVLGSGGHTAEMLNMLQTLPTSRYSHRSYIVSSGDSFSADKAKAFEATLEGLASLRRKPYGSFDISFVPRARRVHQSIITAPFSVISCFMACVRVMSTPPQGYLKQLAGLEREMRNANLRNSRGVTTQQAAMGRYSPYPALILTNGPATGLVVVLASLWLRFFGLAPSGKFGMRAIFVESWARVSSFSLSGKIIVKTGICERVLVQWQGLRERCISAQSSLSRAQVEYIGPLVK